MPQVEQKDLLKIKILYTRLCDRFRDTIDLLKILKKTSLYRRDLRYFLSMKIERMQNTSTICLSKKILQKDCNR